MGVAAEHSEVVTTINTVIAKFSSSWKFHLKLKMEDDISSWKSVKHVGYHLWVFSSIAQNNCQDCEITEDELHGRRAKLLETFYLRSIN